MHLSQPSGRPRAELPRLEYLLKDRVALAIGPELRAIEDAIARQLDPSVPLIHESCEFAAGTGDQGLRRMLRPIILLMTARLVGYRGPRAIHMGCAVILLHTATIMHDIFVDRLALSRNRSSADVRWGDEASVLVGDHFYAKALALMVQDGDPRMLDVLARATVSMTEAEVFHLERNRSGATSEADYLRIVAQKTGSLMSACCQIGSLLASSNADRVEALAGYGLDLGIAVHISDDAMDFGSGGAALGKSLGAYLEAGKRPLPLITTLNRAAPTERNHIQALLERDALTANDIEEIRRLVVKYEGIDYAIERAQTHAQVAKEALHTFPNSDDRDTLALIADFVVDRDDRRAWRR